MKHTIDGDVLFDHAEQLLVYKALQTWIYEDGVNRVKPPKEGEFAEAADRDTMFEALHELLYQGGRVRRLQAARTALTTASAVPLPPRAHERGIPVWITHSDGRYSYTTEWTEAAGTKPSPKPLVDPLTLAMWDAVNRLEREMQAQLQHLYEACDYGCTCPYAGPEGDKSTKGCPLHDPEAEVDHGDR